MTSFRYDYITLKGEFMSKRKSIESKSALIYFLLKTNERKHIEKELEMWAEEEIQRSREIYVERLYPSLYGGYRSS